MTSDRPIDGGCEHTDHFGVVVDMELVFLQRGSRDGLLPRQALIPSVRVRSPPTDTAEVTYTRHLPEAVIVETADRQHTARLYPVADAPGTWRQVESDQAPVRPGELHSGGGVRQWAPAATARSAEMRHMKDRV
ncbi:hypothetical protein MDOR_04320 [Mycolicibacterium doricum]|uniref:Uncharacterized protein n=1 Tax=Mycolicibacterium doricum TaxID=126673 RepID=A0A7I7VQ33_9MYCO|nr:hypothetical protein MDOR_04320 [Mycolicibacterium doricum]